ncbi:hypothetical protein M569_13777 [Genlisea aurea]|uniref:Pectinesterase inhibitor domain-containing protein n=1 Tax=Genlisea aurea TaxID=192259 RepID=S8DE22_9LAMI|nr:hypothetical protein M569_13777 [Genlisea aurea]
MAAEITSIALLVYLAAASMAIAAASFCESAGDRNLCEELTRSATTWAEAMTNGLQIALAKVESGKSIADGVESKLPADMTQQTKQSLVRTCEEDYETAIYNLNQCLGFVDRDPNSSLNVYLSAVSLSDCIDGLNEFQVSLPEVEEYGGQIVKLSSTLLCVASKKP